MYLDFDLFSDNLFIFNHSITLESSAFIKDSLVSILFPKYAKLLNSVVSSAYIINLNILLASEKSLIYMINNKGPSIEPCGTPTLLLLEEFQTLYLQILHIVFGFLDNFLEGVELCHEYHNILIIVNQGMGLSLRI